MSLELNAALNMSEVFLRNVVNALQVVQKITGINNTTYTLVVEVAEEIDSLLQKIEAARDAQNKN